MRVCTWAPTVFSGSNVAGRGSRGGFPDGATIRQIAAATVERLESLGVSDLLIAQRWFGTGEEIEGSSLDCFAMTAWFAAISSQLNLITAVHPGFVSPTTTAKWGATLDRMTEGRWSINVTSGWHLREFDMYGVDPLEHDVRYERTHEFIELLRMAWEQEQVNYRGRWFSAKDLRLEPRPERPLAVFQGGQSDAAVDLAARRSDWMFLNGGTEDRIGSVIARVRQACEATGRRVRFAMYADPLCRDSDAQAWDEIERRLAAIDPALAARRRKSTSGAQGMWDGTAGDLALLDTNEGFVPRLIGSRQTIRDRIDQYRKLGVEMFHLNLADDQFVREVLPEIVAL